MSFKEFEFLADENIHPAVVRFLREQGCDVLDVKESGLVGSTDTALIRVAAEQSRVILTHDSDFRSLVMMTPGPAIGIVYLRPGHMKPEFTISTLLVLLDRQMDLTVPFIIVAERSGHKLSIRIRNL